MATYIHQAFPARDCDWCGDPTRILHKVPMTKDGSPPIVCTDKVCSRCYGWYKDTLGRKYRHEEHRAEDWTIVSRALHILNHGHPYVLRGIRETRDSGMWTIDYRCYRWGQLHLVVTPQGCLYLQIGHGMGGDSHWAWKSVYNTLLPGARDHPAVRRYIRDSVVLRCQSEEVPVYG